MGCFFFVVGSDMQNQPAPIYASLKLAFIQRKLKVQAEAAMSISKTSNNVAYTQVFAVRKQRSGAVSGGWSTCLTWRYFLFRDYHVGRGIKCTGPRRGAWKNNGKQ